MVLVGYACVSTLDQEPSLQEDALRAAACERIFGDRASGALADRPELARALEDARAGNTLAVWRLDSSTARCATSSRRSRCWRSGVMGFARSPS